VRVVLAIVGHYLPGYRAGGPIRSVANLVELMGEDFEFRILTSDRDLGDTAPYRAVTPGCWVRVGKATVRYLAPEEMSLLTFRRVLCDTEYDTVYLNSFFSRMTIWYLVYRRLGLVPVRRTVLAPRGEFSPGALGLKRAKKGVYLALGRAIGLWRGVTFEASSPYEAKDILRSVGEEALLAPDVSLPREREPIESTVDVEAGRALPKRAGELSAVFLSRISATKNLDMALELLFGVGGHITLDIYGPVEDTVYWERCQKLMAALPENVRAVYRGAVAPAKVPEVFARHHVLLLPTRGENFGHVVREALSEGCLPIISDRTPWRGLHEKGAGWDLPLDNRDAFRAALEDVLAMEQDEYDEWSSSARAYVEAYIHEQAEVLPASYRALFGGA